MALGFTTLTVRSFQKNFISYADQFLFSTVEEKKVKSLEHILETRKKVKTEITQLKEKLQQTREKIAEYKDVVAAHNPSQ